MRIAPWIVVLALFGCAAPSPPPARFAIDPPRHDALFTPGDPIPGHLEYSGDRDNFAPILTERVAFPTQGEANSAFARATARPGLYVVTFEGALTGERSLEIGTEPPVPAGVRLFACAPGALDEQTGRVEAYRGHVVHCATDFLGIDGARLFRATVNFVYIDQAWSMSLTHPPISKAAWLASEPSPNDAWWWIPGRGRYE